LDTLRPTGFAPSARRVAVSVRDPGLGLAGAPGEVFDDLGGKAGRETSPVRRQEVDEDLFAGLKDVDLHRPDQRQPQAAAVRVAADLGHRAAQIGREAFLLHRDRARKGDDHNPGCRARRHLGDRIEFEQDAGEALCLGAARSESARLRGAEPGEGHEPGERERERRPRGRFPNRLTKPPHRRDPHP
jgi:hypothetical protein